MKRRRQETIAIGLAQFKAIPGDVSGNIDKMRSIIHQHADDVDLIVFPEYSVPGYVKDDANYDCALKVTDSRFAELLVASKKVDIAFGFIEENDSFEFYNSLAFLRDGKVAQIHRKIYLVNYGIFEERKHFSVGPTYHVWQYEKFRIAPFICGDAWNPALVHLAAADNSHIMLFPAFSPEEGLGGRLSTADSWRRLTSLYSLLYGVYTVFVNRVGDDQGLKLWGGSEIRDPYGKVVVESETNDEEFLTAELDLSNVREARTILHTIRDEDLHFLNNRIETVIKRKHKAAIELN